MTTSAAKMSAPVHDPGVRMCTAAVLMRTACLPDACVRQQPAGPRSYERRAAGPMGPAALTPHVGGSVYVDPGPVLDQRSTYGVRGIRLRSSASFAIRLT